MKLTKAMILAAGFGTRLKPLTDKIPKPLIKVNGTPMIEIVIKKLIGKGISDIVINTHYFSEKIKEYFQENKFNAGIHLVYEKEILGTGGGIKNAAEYLRCEDNFLVYNVDILSDINIDELYNFHLSSSPIASLAVKKRDSKRLLIFNKNLDLVGRKNEEKEIRYFPEESNDIFAGFCGIHIISSKIFEHFTEEGFFDIFTSYFRLVKEGNKIKGFDVGDSYWEDMGKINNKKFSFSV